VWAVVEMLVNNGGIPMLHNNLVNFIMISEIEKKDEYLEQGMKQIEE
jgi:hypothetical protein